MVLARSFPPSLPESRSCPAPGVQNEARGAPARGGHQVHARTTALTPRTPNKTRPPRAAQDRFAQPGVRQSPGPRAPAATGSAAETGRQPLSRPSWPRRTLKGESPSTPRSHPKSPWGAGGRPGASGLPGLAPNLPGAASAAAAAGGRAAAAAAATGQGRLGPGRALRGRRDRLRSGSCSSQIRAGVTALRRRCSLAQQTDRCSPARCPAACSPGCPPPLAFLMSTDSEKELGVRG